MNGIVALAALICAAACERPELPAAVPLKSDEAENEKIVRSVCGDPSLPYCPYQRATKRGLLAPGIIIDAFGAALLAYGAMETAFGVELKNNPGPDPGSCACGFAFGVPLLVTGIIHEAIGIPLTVAGAQRHWEIKRGRRVLCEITPTGLTF